MERIKRVRQVEISGEEVRAIRVHMNLSQGDFARKLDVSANTVARWEQGSRRPAGPAAILLRLLAHPSIRERVFEIGL